MKDFAPKTPEEYFAKTEYAVKHLYAGLDSCWALYQDAERHVAGMQMDQPLTQKQKVELENYLELSRKYFKLNISENMFSGGILQIAHMAIKIFSRNDSIPESCEVLVKSRNHPAVQFCIGEEKYGIPKCPSGDFMSRVNRLAVAPETPS